MRACVLSPFSRVQLFATLWIIALQPPLSKGSEATGIPPVISALTEKCRLLRWPKCTLHGWASTCPCYICSFSACGPSCSPIGSGTGSAAAMVLLGYLCLAHRSPAAHPLGSAVPRTLQWTGPARLLTGASILHCIGDGYNMRLGWHPIGMGQNPLQRWGPLLVPKAGMLKDIGPSR